MARDEVNQMQGEIHDNRHGDKVTVELTPFDITRARILFRSK
jgi:hypothetical protein